MVKEQGRGSKMNQATASPPRAGPSRFVAPPPFSALRDSKDLGTNAPGLPTSYKLAVYFPEARQVAGFSSDLEIQALKKASI